MIKSGAKKDRILKLDPIQCEENTCTIFNRVQFILKTRVQFYVIRRQMNKKKNKPKRVQFYIAIAIAGIGACDCYRSLLNILEERYWKYKIKIYYVRFRPLYRPCLPSYYATFQIKDTT